MRLFNLLSLLLFIGVTCSAQQTTVLPDSLTLPTPCLEGEGVVELADVQDEPCVNYRTYLLHPTDVPFEYRLTVVEGVATFTYLIQGDPVKVERRLVSGGGLQEVVFLYNTFILSAQELYGQ